MNIIGDLEVGNNVIVWGTATAPKTKTTQSGKTVTEFQLVVGVDSNQDKIYLKITAWEKLAKQFASFIDKHDALTVIGKVVRDDYWTEKNQRETYAITANRIMAQQFYGEEAGSSMIPDDDLMNLP